jgi:multimeric flavodoxin WrbA
MPTIPIVRTGQAPPKLPRDQFRARFLEAFYDPAYQAESAAIDRLEAIAWDAYQQGRKAPITEKAGPGYADPEYDLSVEWARASDRLKSAQIKWEQRSTPSRILLVCCSSRNDGTCPGEMSKTFRLTQLAREVVETEGPGTEVDVLDLSLLNSDYDRHIHPCKGCASTAMPLCHWPCSCYPNHAERQAGDWMNEIYERWVSAHGVILLTPVYWYQVASPLKLMMDRMVCADGGNADPTSTHGKKAAEAKALELQGWEYPKHLAGRMYGVVVHGDVAGIEGVRRSLSDWLDWMGLNDAGVHSRLDRFIGYYEPYANSHDTLDQDECVQEEVRNVARAVLRGVQDLRSGRFHPPGCSLQRPRPK